MQDVGELDGLRAVSRSTTTSRPPLTSDIQISATETSKANEVKVTQVSSHDGR